MASKVLTKRMLSALPPSMRTLEAGPEYHWIKYQWIATGVHYSVRVIIAIEGYRDF